MPGAARRGWSIFLFILIVVAAIIGVIVASVPLTKTVPIVGTTVTECPSLFSEFSGQTDSTQNAISGIANSVTGDCDNFYSQGFGSILLLGVAIVLFLIIALPLAISGSVARGRFMRTRLAQQPSVAGYAATAPAAAAAGPSGWYVDPSHPGMQRYWNGMMWTDDYRPTA